MTESLLNRIKAQLVRHEGLMLEKKPIVADLSLGASFSINMFKLTYRHLFRTEQFDGQEKGHTIGSLTLAVSF
ncbi:MAG: DUF2219 family protein [Candidatus Syntrophosphaera sp.]